MITLDTQTDWQTHFQAKELNNDDQFSVLVAARAIARSKAWSLAGKGEEEYAAKFFEISHLIDEVIGEIGEK